MAMKTGKDPEILNNRVGGGAMALLGLPFFFIGLFVLLWGVSRVSDAPIYVMIPFGAIFSIVGILVLFGRSGTDIDRRKKTLTSWKSFFGYRWSKTYPLDFYRRVRIDREVRTSKNSSYTVYPVRLEGMNEAPQISIEENQDYGASRKVAEMLSKFMRVPLADLSTGAESVREADDMDRSILDVAKKDPIEAETDVFIAEPDGMRTTVRREGADLIVEIPPPPASPARWSGMLPTAIFSIVTLIFFVRPMIMDKGTPFSVLAVILGFFLIFFVALPNLVAYRSITKKTKKPQRILASRYRLRVEAADGKSKAVEIPVSAIEEFFIDRPALLEGMDRDASGKVNFDSAALARNAAARGMDPKALKMLSSPLAQKLLSFAASNSTSPGITARSDDQSVSFAEDLPDAEMAYIFIMLKRAMVSDAPPNPAGSSADTTFASQDTYGTPPDTTGASPNESGASPDKPGGAQTSYGDNSGFKNKY